MFREQTVVDYKDCQLSSHESLTRRLKAEDYRDL